MLYATDMIIQQIHRNQYMYFEIFKNVLASYYTRL